MRMVAFARRLGVAAGLVSSLIAVLLGLVTIVATPSAASAQTLTGNCWKTVIPGGGACYSNPQQACQRQFQEYATTHIGPYEPYSDTQYRTAKNCHWVWHVGDSGASSVSYVCPDGSSPVSDKCPGLDMIPLQPCNCGQNGGGTPDARTDHPIDILSGNKSFQVDDFSTADGSLRLHRIYSSLGSQGAASQPVADPLGMTNWLFDFQYELQLGSDWTNYSILALTVPDGRTLAFYKAADGTLKPFANNSYVQPQTDLTLAFVGSWPASLSTLTSASTQWTLTDGDDTTWTLQTFLDPQTGLYDIARPVTMIRRDGVQWTFSYATPYQLLAITDSFGKQMTFDWIVNDARAAGGFAAVRAISAVHLPGGYSIKYSYDTVGSFPAGFVEPDRLSQVQYLDASGVVQDQVSYQYGNASFPNALTAILDKNGVQRWSVTYDSQGRATNSTGPSGADSATVAYGTISGGPSTFTRTVTNALGKQFTYTFARSSSNQISLSSVNSAATANTPATTTAYAYGSDSFVSSHTDEKGNVTTYTRDPRGMADQTVEASGTSSARTSTTTWDTTRRLPTQVVAPGVTTSYTYDTTAGGGAAGGGVLNNKRYWRIRITNSNGAYGGGNYYTNIADIQLYETAGGGEVGRGAAANWTSNYNSSYPPANALDGSIATETSLVNGSSGPPYTNTWWIFDFGAGVSKTIRGVAVTAPTDSTTGPPSDFAVEWSPDGNTWTSAWTVSGQTGWNLGETRLFVDPAYSYTGSFWGSHLYWRAEMGAHAVSGLWSGAEVKYHATPGAADEIGTATASASSYETGGYDIASYAHDGNLATFWQSNYISTDQWIQFQFASAVPLAEVNWTARNDSNYGQAPTSGSMAYSDDGVTWREAFPILKSSAWTIGQSYNFTDPYYH